MDLLQLSLVFLIFLLAVMLSVLGIQVFFILKDLKKSLDKLDIILDDTHSIASDLQKPVKMAADVTQVVETGMAAAKILGSRIVNRKDKAAKRVFKIK